MSGQLVNAIESMMSRMSQRSGVHNIALALVWLTMASSGFVFTEPCPTDALTMALIVLLPAIGLVRFSAPAALLMMILAGSAAFGLVSATAAFEMSKAVSHTLVSLYLYGATFVLAGFVALKPGAHSRLIFNGLTVAASIAGAAGLIGYFDLVPGADIFTKFGRASGTFKDPNVFGPFLVPAFLYAIHTALERPLTKAVPPLALAGFLALGIFLSFSRGAWMNLLAGLAIYAVLAFLTAATNGRRQKIAALAASGALLVCGVVGGALQSDKVSSLVSERASVAQSYDVGPEGRFGGQEKAYGLILENPLGIGAGQFALVYHHEEPHNVYLSMPLNAGWLGAGFYDVAVALTLLAGLAGCFQRSATQPVLLIAVAAFAANAFEGVIIDTDHWRHFYLLMALVWGMAPLGSTRAVFARAEPRRRVDYAAA